MDAEMLLLPKMFKESKSISNSDKKSNIMKGNINEDHLFQIRKIIGQWLIQLREEKGLTQNQLAEEMGITRTTVSKIESGKWNYAIKKDNRM
jgi:DNA-binding XRE family transcriptional regulator